MENIKYEDALKAAEILMLYIESRNIEYLGKSEILGDRKNELSLYIALNDYFK